MTICVNEICTKKATFNILGQKAKFCAEHKDPDMVDVLNKKCECNSSQPRWNFPGLKPLCCVSCKKEGMIETHRKKCFCGKVRPTFNFEGLKAEFCNSCKSENMINVVDDRCFCNKLTSPNFNYENLRPKYCFECKLPDMVDVRNPKCPCGSRTNFNFKGLNRIDEVLRVIPSDWELLIVGIGEKYEIPTKYQNRIRAMDGISRHDLWNLLESLGAIVIASPFESFSMVALEGIVQGVPIISLGPTGIKEFYDEYVRVTGVKSLFFNQGSQPIFSSKGFLMDSIENQTGFQKFLLSKRQAVFNEMNL